MLIKPGFTAVTSSNMVLSDRFATTSLAIIIGAFLYCFAAAMAPLHWYSHKSGRLDRDTLAKEASYPAFSNAGTSSCAIRSNSFFILTSSLLFSVHQYHRYLIILINVRIFNRCFTDENEVHSRKLFSV